jgi:hypothetical protein
MAQKRRFNIEATASDPNAVYAGGNSNSIQRALAGLNRQLRKLVAKAKRPEPTVSLKPEFPLRTYRRISPRVPRN